MKPGYPTSPSSPKQPTSPLRFTRRNLLRGGLAATAAIPLLETTRAWAQTAPPTRFVTFATPNGTRNSLFWPTGTETNFNFNTFTPDLGVLAAATWPAVRAALSSPAARAWFAEIIGEFYDAEMAQGSPSG